MTRILIAILAIALASPASAIIRREEVDDAAFLAAAEGHDNVAAIIATDDGRILASGTLIAPDLVLTAGHVGRGVRTRGDGAAVRFDRDYAISNVYIHPLFDTSPPNFRYDIAVLQLAESVEGITPAGLYRQDDEHTKVLTLVGWGDYGTSATGPEGSDGQLRAGENYVDLADGPTLAMFFDTPDEGEPLEAVSGPGDSGGPGFIYVDDMEYVAGVSSGQNDEGSGGLPGRYGVIEYYIRVSAVIDWLDEVMTGAATE